MEVLKGGHHLLRLEPLGEWRQYRSVMYIKLNVCSNKRDIEKIHRVLNHKGVKNLECAFRNIGKLDPKISKMIRETVEECEICKKNSRSRSKPAVAIPRATDFNSIVTLDLKEMSKKYIL